MSATRRKLDVALPLSGKIGVFVPLEELREVKRLLEAQLAVLRHFGVLLPEDVAGNTKQAPAALLADAPKAASTPLYVGFDLASGPDETWGVMIQGGRVVGCVKLCGSVERIERVIVADKFEIVPPPI